MITYLTIDIVQQTHSPIRLHHLSHIPNLTHLALHSVWLEVRFEKAFDGVLVSTHALHKRLSHLKCSERRGQGFPLLISCERSQCNISMVYKAGEYISPLHWAGAGGRTEGPRKKSHLQAATLTLRRTTLQVWPCSDIAPPAPRTSCRISDVSKVVFTFLAAPIRVSK